MLSRVESCFGLQPSQKMRDIRVVKVRSEPRSSFFQVTEFIFRNTNGITPEIIEVTGYQRKLFASLKRCTGAYVVAHLLFVWAAFSQFLFIKTMVKEVLLPRQLFIHTHCINERPMARTLFFVRSTSANHPIASLRLFNEIFRLVGRIPKFTTTKRTNPEVWIRGMTAIVLDHVGKQLRHDLPSRSGAESVALCL